MTLCTEKALDLEQKSLIRPVGDYGSFFVNSMRRTLNLKCAMKKLIFIGLLFLAILPAQAKMQDDIDHIVLYIQEAIENGRAESMVDKSSSFVEVTLLGNSTLYSRAQAGYILKEFFREHPPSEFAFQRRLNVGNDWYVYGSYRNRAEKETYRIEIRIRRNGDGYEIKNIRITNAG